MDRKILIIVMFIFIFSSIYTVAQTHESITFLTNHTEYYFKIGDNAVIPFTVKSSLNSTEGQLTYTVTQQIQQQGMMYQSSNTQSQNFLVTGEPFAINVGTSQNQGVLLMQLSFDYYDKSVSQNVHVKFPEIKIYFVQNTSQQNNQNNQNNNNQNPQDSSKSAESTSQTQEEIKKQADEEAKKQQDIAQKQAEEAMKQQEMQNQLQNRLQNNQMRQDTNALKQQMQKQIDAQKQMEQEFKKSLEANKDLRDAHNDMLSRGYNQTDFKMDPSGNSSGNFSMEYIRGNSTIQMKGEMKNNTLNSLKKFEIKDDFFFSKALVEDKRFKDYENKLLSEGFSRKEIQISRNSDSSYSDYSGTSINSNLTIVTVSYIDASNVTAAIVGEFINRTIRKVTLDKPIRNLNFYLFILAVFTILLILFFFISKNKKKTVVFETEKEVIKEEPFDYRKEALKMILEGQKDYERNKHKDAYSKVSYAIRLYYSHKHGLKKEITNGELVRSVSIKEKKNKSDMMRLKETLDLCSMVEFANAMQDNHDFSKVVEVAREYVK